MLRASTADTYLSPDDVSRLAAMTVDLGNGYTLDSWFGGTGQLVNIQAARGSAFADFMVVGLRADRLEGGAGVDVV